jgi:hypothetical protein
VLLLSVSVFPKKANWILVLSGYKGSVYRQCFELGCTFSHGHRVSPSGIIKPRGAYPVFALLILITQLITLLTWTGRPSSPTSGSIGPEIHANNVFRLSKIRIGKVSLFHLCPKDTYFSCHRHKHTLSKGVIKLVRAREHPTSRPTRIFPYLILNRYIPS